MNRPLTLAMSLSLSLASLAACDSGGDAKPAAGAAKPGDPPAGAAAGGTDAEVAAAWTVCASCHGEAGAGDGVAAAALDPKPRNFGDAAWQDKVDDAHIKKVILEGGTAVGLSPLMTPNPQLKDKPAVVDGLVKKIRGLKK